MAAPARRSTVGGRKVGLREESNYPWSGAIRIAVDPEAPADVRPEASHSRLGRHATLKVNGETVDVGANSKDGYVAIRRSVVKRRRGRARPADAGASASTPIPTSRWTSAVSASSAAPSSIAPSRPTIAVPVPHVRLPRNAGVETVEKRDLFDGVVTLVASGRAARVDDWDGHLYRPDPPLDEPAKWTAIPYFLWNNREPGSMVVWIPEA